MSKPSDHLSDRKRALFAKWAAGKAKPANAEATKLDSQVSADGLDLRTSPLSFAQERLWLVDRLQPFDAAFVEPRTFRALGPLDASVLERALREMIQRHAPLRSVVVDSDGAPQIETRDAADWKMELVDLSTCQSESEFLEQAKSLLLMRSQAPMDLENDVLLRATLVRRNAQDHVLHLVVHHFVFDDVSALIMGFELQALYRAFLEGQTSPLKPVSSQFSRYSGEQRRKHRQGGFGSDLAYWRGVLRGLDTLNLPLDRSRPSVSTSAGDILVFDLGRERIERLRERAREFQTTPFAWLFASLQTLLYRYTGQNRICIGMPFHGRTESAWNELIGFFSNTLPIAGDLDSKLPFSEWVKKAYRSVLDGIEHGEVPLELVMKEMESDRGRSPLFQVMFAMQNAGPARLDLPEVELLPLEWHNRRSKMDLSLYIAEAAEGALEAKFEFSTEIFDRATIERLAVHFCNLLDAVGANPEVKLREVEYLSPEEKHGLLFDGRNATATDFGEPQALFARFEAQVDRTPDAPAISVEGTTLSYRELNQLSNQLAWKLRNLGVGRESVIGICAERSLEMVVGIYGVLKAGAAYLPLDPAFPVDRLEFMLEDSQVPLVLCQNRYLGLFAKSAAQKLDLDAVAQTCALESAENPKHPHWHRKDLAYVIYTSGSTGKPKGVMTAHDAIDNCLSWKRTAYPLTSFDKVLQQTPYSFDVSIWEFFPPLFAGAHLVMARPEGHRDPQYLIETIQNEQITILYFVPPLLDALLDEEGVEHVSTVRQVFCIGQELPPKTVEKFFRKWNAELHNLYGPTEAAVGITSWPCSTADVTTVPIGYSIPNNVTYVLDAELNPVPVGVSGELFLGGDGLARGYLGRPALTAERFIANPFRAGERMYRTGDRVRTLPNGALEYLGRLDFQIKLRGIRIEIGEIESAMRAAPGVKQAVVSLVGQGADTNLVGFVVLDKVDSAWEPRIFEALRKELPEYMVPSYLVALDALPMSSNGKIDRKKILLHAHTARTTTYRAPSCDLERSVVALWSEVLGNEKIGLDDDFFRLGGHSLLAMKLLSRAKRRWQIDLPLKTVFEHPTVERFTARISASLGDESGRSNKIVSADGPAPLSAAQSRLWFLYQLEPDNASYHIPITLRLTGNVDAAILKIAVEKLVARHVVLRSSFRAGELGRAVQVPLETWKLPWEEVTLSESDAHSELERRARIRFDLEQDALPRVTLLRLHPEVFLLQMVFHHLVFDEWSLAIVAEEIQDNYRAIVSGANSELPELSIQYADYARWQEKRLRSSDLLTQLVYWKRKLNGLATLQLPTDFVRPPVQSFQGSYLSIPLPKELEKPLRELAVGHQATLSMVLMAAYQVLLSRYSRQEDIAVGMPVTHRDRLELENLVGFFLNTLVIRSEVSGALAFTDLLNQVRSTQLEAMNHQEVPFELLVEELQPARDLSRNPLFQVLFVFQNLPSAHRTVAGIQIEVEDVPNHTAKFDLSLFVRASESGLETTWEYSTDLFERATIEAMAERYAELLSAIAKNPTQAVDSLAIAEKNPSTAKTSQVTKPVEGTAVKFFTGAVAKLGDVTAVECGGRRLTYKEVHRLSNLLAFRLLEQGAKPGKPVVVSLTRSTDSMVALLAVWKVGGVYMPVDPTIPIARRQAMLQDSGAKVLITQSGLLDVELSETLRLTAIFADDAEGLQGEADRAPAIEVQSTDIAYLLYTSGSTGRPKGVAVSHRVLVNLVQWHLDTQEIKESVRVLQFASHGFDVSLQEFVSTWATGSTLVMPNDEERRDLLGLSKFLSLHGITRAFLPPAVLQYLADSHRCAPSLSPLREVVVAGEALRVSDSIREFREHVGFVLLNHYGPTETHVATTYRVPTDDGSQLPPIGRGIHGAETYVLDANLRLVSDGMLGELYLAGEILAEGYWQQPGMTAERFMPNPYGLPGSRMYRTGDLVKRNRKGFLEYQGRVDTQVKVRGFRVELSEIDTHLASHPAIAYAVSEMRRTAGEAALVAYWIPKDSTAIPPSETSLKNYLKERLPEYMVPSAIVPLLEFPLNANGKVDRGRLPAPPEAIARVAVPAETESQRRLVGIWKEVLGASVVGIDDGFFEMGGHSLKIAEAHRRITQAWDREIPLVKLFQFPTVRMLSQFLDEPAPVASAAGVDRAALRKSRLRTLQSEAGSISETLGTENL